MRLPDFPFFCVACSMPARVKSRIASALFWQPLLGDYPAELIHLIVVERNCDALRLSLRRLG
jgi:hypothetical protein